MADYSFGAGQFRNQLWLGSKRVFVRPRGVEIEFTTSGPMSWLIADAAGSIVKTVPVASGGGWKTIDFASLGLYDNYSIGFQNNSSVEQRIRAGTVWLRD